MLKFYYKKKSEIFPLKETKESGGIFWNISFVALESSKLN
jgi:hypothetical protein